MTDHTRAGATPLHTAVSNRRCDGARPAATRIDPDSGAEEKIEFLGDSQRLFAARHTPPGEVRGGVVICSPFQAEFLKNYRREVLLARALAGRGFAVQRFHYRGTGNSDGETPTFESMCADAAAAAAELTSAAGVSELSFVGARFGGLVAAATANAYPGAPLALWEPVVNTGSYFRELFRVRMIRELKDEMEDRTTAAAMMEELEGGSVDIIGFSVDRPLYQSAGNLRLGDLLRDAARPVLLIQTSRRTDLKAPQRRLKETWEKAGAAMTVHSAGDEEAWWFESDVFHTEENRPLSKRLVAATADWISGLEAW